MRDPIRNWLAGAASVLLWATAADALGVDPACAQPLVRQILEITKLTKLFGDYHTVSEALAAQ